MKTESGVRQGSVPSRRLLCSGAAVDKLKRSHCGYAHILFFSQGRIFDVLESSLLHDGPLTCL